MAKTKKKSGKILGIQGKISEFHEIKKVATLTVVPFTVGCIVEFKYFTGTKTPTDILSERAIFPYGTRFAG